MDKKIFIYALLDPRIKNEKNIRYIGKTNNIRRRLQEHIKSVKQEKTYKSSWIKNLLKSGEKPILKVIEEVKENEWEEKEKYYIRKFLDDGHKLTNLDMGGNSGLFNCEKEKRIKMVAKIDTINGQILNIYHSISEAVVCGGYKSNSRISDCCHGKCKTSNGFFWRFLDKDGRIIAPAFKKEFVGRKKRVAKILNGLIVEVYSSITEASAKNGQKHISNIHSCCCGKTKKTKGYEWRYVDEKNNIITPKVVKYLNKKIFQIDTKTKKIVKEFNKLKSAAEFVGVSPDAIYASTKRKNGTCAGFEWEIIYF